VSDLSELKARIDIIDVLEAIGAELEMQDAWDDEVLVKCPFCEDKDSHDPAASANSVKGLYFCHQCGFGGTIIDVAMAYIYKDRPADPVFGKFKATIPEAVAWLEANWPAPEEESDGPWNE
jgi:hypothetical protein